MYAWYGAHDLELGFSSLRDSILLISAGMTQGPWIAQGTFLAKQMVYTVIYSSYRKVLPYFFSATS